MEEISKEIKQNTDDTDKWSDALANLGMKSADIDGLTDGVDAFTESLKGGKGGGGACIS